MTKIKRNKKCGSCIEFTKWKNDKWGGGLCETLDARTTSGSGGSCKFYKHIKYHKEPYYEKEKYQVKGRKIN